MYVGCFSLTTFFSSKLKPKLSEADQFDIIKVCTDSVLGVPVQSPVLKKKDPVVVSML